MRPQSVLSTALPPAWLAYAPAESVHAGTLAVSAGLKVLLLPPASASAPQLGQTPALSRFKAPVFSGRWRADGA